MPTYEFMCEKCEKAFDLRMTISEREKAAIKCPSCNGTKVTPLLGSFLTQTTKKS